MPFPLYVTARVICTDTADNRRRVIRLCDPRSPPLRRRMWTTRWILREIRECLPLIDRTTSSLSLTGGEPLLDWQDFVEVIGQCRDGLPGTAIHVLSNGRAFANNDVVAAWTDIRHPNLTVSIPAQRITTGQSPTWPSAAQPIALATGTIGELSS